MRLHRLVSCLFIACAAVASGRAARAETPSPFFQNPYMWSENEGHWTGRLGIGAMFTGADFAEMDAPASASDFEGNLVSSSLFINADLEYRMTEHIALSASLGYIPQETQTLARVAPYAQTAQQIEDGDDTFTITDSAEGDTPGRFNFIPVSLSLLYYPAPYGAIRPYLGAGYHYTKIISGFSRVKADDAHGFVGRIGADWWVDDSWGFNLDIRYQQAEFDIDLGEFYPADEPDGPGDTTATNVSKGTLELNPITVNFGVNYRF